MPVAPESVLTAAAARRIALAAQGFGRPRGVTPVTSAALRSVVRRVGFVQVDSVNVVARSHYLPFYSRLGPYDPALLDALRDAPVRRAAAEGARRPARLVEYWAHEASLMAPETWPLFSFRMTRAAKESWGGMRRVAAEHPDLVRSVLAEILAHGPLTARELEARLEHDAPRSREDWGWNWSLVKQALELLFWSGRVTSAGRTNSFERRYAAAEHVLPPQFVALGPDGSGPHREPQALDDLVELSARAIGVGTLGCLRDYARLRPEQITASVDRLVAGGRLIPVRVDCWKRPAYLHVDARLPRAIRTRALLSPFDSLIWTRDRVRALFGFDFRLEIYTPAAKRVHGYYVLPFLLDEALVGRVDLKADRAAGVLRVHAVHWEPSAPPHAGEELRAELEMLASFLGLSQVRHGRPAPAPRGRG